MEFTEANEVGAATALAMGAGEELCKGLAASTVLGPALAALSAPAALGTVLLATTESSPLEGTLKAR